LTYSEQVSHDSASGVGEGLYGADSTFSLKGWGLRRWQMFSVHKTSLQIECALCKSTPTRKVKLFWLTSHYWRTVPEPTTRSLCNLRLFNLWPSENKINRLRVSETDYYFATFPSHSDEGFSFYRANIHKHTHIPAHSHRSKMIAVSTSSARITTLILRATV